MPPRSNGSRDSGCLCLSRSDLSESSQPSLSTPPFLYLLDGRQPLLTSLHPFCFSGQTAPSPHLQQPPDFSPHFPAPLNRWGIYMGSHLFQSQPVRSVPRRQLGKPGLATCRPLPAHILPPCPILSPWNRSVLTLSSPQPSRDRLQYIPPLRQNNQGQLRS